jgi:HAD superfamily hydrolase (TIGR01509 family)
LDTWDPVPQPKDSAHLHPAIAGARAVLFDVGGTLLHPDWARIARLAEDACGRTLKAEELRAVFCDTLRGVDTDLRDGNQPPGDSRRSGWLFLRTFTALGLDETECERLRLRLDEAHRERHLWCDLDPQAPRVIESLRRAGLRTAVISNTEDGRLEELLQITEIARHFELCVDSQVVGLRKPDVAIFHLAVSRLGVEPAEAVYVGDSYGFDVLGARAAGLRPILFDPLDLHRGRDCARIRALGQLIDHDLRDGA